MARQKRIALINDITGFGRCSVTVQLPLISAMRVQACPLPTAILSVHTGFPNHYLDDYTARMRPYMENWAENGLTFDALLTGFLGSEEQIKVVLDCIRRFKGKDTEVIVDPVMGDNGKLYSSYTPELCAKMRQLLPHADVVTPNLTEACQLLGVPYPPGGLVSMPALEKMAADIAAMGPRDVIITGLHAGDRVRTYLYGNGRGHSFDNAKVGHDRSGSGLRRGHRLLQISLGTAFSMLRSLACRGTMDFRLKRLWVSLRCCECLCMQKLPRCGSFSHICV